MAGTAERKFCDRSSRTVVVVVVDSDIGSPPPPEVVTRLVIPERGHVGAEEDVAGGEAAPDNLRLVQQCPPCSRTAYSKYIGLEDVLDRFGVPANGYEVTWSAEA